MLGPDDIQRLCERRYPGFLRSIVTGEEFFPLRVAFGRPSGSDEWPTLQAEISALAGATMGYRIDWDEINTRRWGRQRLPVRVFFENEPEFLTLLRKHAEVRAFRENLAHTREALPELTAWLPGNVLRVVEFGPVWRELLMVCRYFLAHPRPQLYVRQLPLPVDTKFVERHQGILRELLDFLLPATARLETSHFEERFGLRYEEASIRFRLLDPDLKRRLTLPVDDLNVPLSQFRDLGFRGSRILIVENKMTFLTLPPLTEGIGVFGGGVAAELLTSVVWLRDCRIVYWGDLDVHGFHILARLRRGLPQVKSVMMNAEVLDRFMTPAATGKPATHEFVETLTSAERQAYAQVQAGNLLLEQEKIPHAFAVAELRKTWGDE